MTGEHYRETATAPAYDLVLAVRRRRLRYLGHVLRMPSDRMVRCALMTLVTDTIHLRSSKATGCDNVPVVAYRGSVHATNELFRICRMMCHSERIPPELVRGTFIMLHKKGSRDDMANYRAICLLCHSYKLLSAFVARRLMAVLDERLPDTQAGFRSAGGCRDNVCALGWFIDMVLREGRQAVVTFIDYSAAFDTESQLFFDIALAETGVSSKVRRIVQAIFAAATGRAHYTT